MHLQEINTKWFWILFWIEVGSLKHGVVSLKFKIGDINSSLNQKFALVGKITLFDIQDVCYMKWVFEF
jgi:hypothetical protein